MNFIAIFPAMRVLSGFLRKGIKFKTDLVIRKRKEIRRRRRRRKEEEKEKEKEKKRRKISCIAGGNRWYVKGFKF